MPKKDRDAAPLVESDTWFYLSINEVSTSFGVPKETILDMIEEGIVQAKKNEQEEWLVDSEALTSIHIVLRLNHDLGVNLPGAALALQLLKEIDHLDRLLRQKT